MVALATPLNEDETVDATGLRRLLHRVLDGGVHGVVVLGTAGECVALTDREKRRAVEITVDEVAGRVPVIAGTGEPGTKRALETTRMAAKSGVDAALVVPPYYYRLKPAAVVDFYRRLASEAGLPILLYNIPFFTKVPLDIDTVRELAQEEGIAGIKDSGGDFSHFQRLTRIKSETFGVVTGSDGLLFASLAVGGDGSIGPGANLTPRWFVDLWQATRDARWEDAWAIEQRIMAANSALGYGTFPAGLKAALSLIGICRNVVASPISPVAGQQLAEIEAGLKALGLL